LSKTSRPSSLGRVVIWADLSSNLCVCVCVCVRVCVFFSLINYYKPNKNINTDKYLFPKHFPKIALAKRGMDWQGNDDKFTNQMYTVLFINFYSLKKIL